jgi:hypothetical protein
VFFGFIFVSSLCSIRDEGSLHQSVSLIRVTDPGH